MLLQFIKTKKPKRYWRRNLFSGGTVIALKFLEKLKLDDGIGFRFSSMRSLADFDDLIMFGAKIFKSQ